jgi:DNA-binding XRE family transcriptional regulator
MSISETVVLQEACKMMIRINVDKERRQLWVWFADGRLAIVPVEEIEKAGRLVTLDLDKVKLTDPYVILIGTVDGDDEEVPWDLTRHYCDSEFTLSEQEKDELSRRVLGARVRQLREDAGLSQEKLAGRAGLGRVTISRLENGERYTQTQTLKSVAEALGVTLADLLVATESKRRSSKH